ncbi:MAG: hypothetical protein IKM18_00290 [Clostridia bacterium]|nr:hypothetical protein [Clostridia bacterium]MBR3714328.1 hypothetical protein [Clostridia bacterium]
MELITNYLLQLVFSIGIIVVFGLLIMLCRRWFCNLMGPKGYKILLITGAVGTPIHELSHALMCLIFGHKITDMKLYQPDSDDGTLGYVNHSYNPKNLYHQIGNFFIGIAPIVCGNAFLLFLMALLVPDVFSDVGAAIAGVDPSFGGYISVIPEIFAGIFSPSNFADWRWWIFLVLAIMVASHMELSPADIKGSVVGLLCISGIVLVVDVLLFIISISALEVVTEAFITFSAYMASFLVLSVFFLLLMVLVALAVSGIRNLRR